MMHSRWIRILCAAWTSVACFHAAAPPAYAVTDVSELVARAMPATVAITAHVPPPTPKGKIELDVKPGFSSLLDPQPERSQAALTQLMRPVREGPIHGTGFVIHGSGQIIASTQTVQGATLIEVNFVDGRTEPADLVGTDGEIALLKVRRSGLPSLSLASGKQVQQGDLVVAVGMLGGTMRTVTAGVVSSVDTRIHDRKPRFIVTDTRTGNGFAGGPLLNAAGQVIGMHDAMLFRAGEWAGVSFAIAADEVRAALARIRATQ